MNPAAAIFARLSAAAGVTAIVGTSICPQYTEADVFPRLIYSIDADDPVLTHDGNASLTQAVVTIQAMARTYDAAIALAAAVKATLDFQAGVWGGVSVQRAIYKHQTEQELTPADLGEAGRALLVTQTYDLWYIR